MDKPFKVCERIYQVGGPDMTSGQDCCVYLLDGGPGQPGTGEGEGRSLGLIDAGYGPSYKAVLANIIRLGFDPEDLDSLLLTHCHIDHTGGAASFQGEYGPRVIAHREAAVPLESGDRMSTAAFLYGVRLEPPRIDLKLERDEEEVAVGDLVLTILYTPGHSPGSISAYTDVGRTRVLFGQDIHGPFHPDFGSDINRWRESMLRLLELEADILCEGHFGIYSPNSAVSAYINGYLEQFEG